MSALSVDASRLLKRIRALGALGRDDQGRLTRLAASDADKLGRDAFVGWLEAAGREVADDRIGNIFGSRSRDGRGAAFQLRGAATARALRATAPTSAARRPNAVGSPADFATRPIKAGPTRLPA